MARIKRKIIDRLSVLQWDKKEDGERKPTILEITQIKSYNRSFEPMIKCIYLDIQYWVMYHLIQPPSRN